MSINFRAALNNAEKALSTNQSLISCKSTFKLEKTRAICCRFSHSKLTMRQFRNEEAAWKKLRVEISKNEQWTKEYHASYAATLQKHLVKRKADLYKQTHGLWAVWNRLTKGQKHIRHCKRLLAEMRQLSQVLNKSHDVVEEILKISRPKRLDSFLRRFFPERVRKKEPTIANFTDPAKFYIIKKGCCWHLSYLDPITNQLCRQSIKTPSQVQALHNRLTACHFYKSSINTLPAHPYFRVQYTEVLSKRPSAINEQNLVIVNPEGKAFYRTAGNRLNEIQLPFTSDRGALNRHFKELLETVEDAQCYEKRATHFQNNQSELNKIAHLKVINRYEDLPEDNRAFFEKHQLTEASKIDEFLTAVTVIPAERYKKVRVYTIDPVTFRLTYKTLDFDFNASFEELIKKIKDIQNEQLKVYQDYMDQVRELKNKGGLNFIENFSIGGCSITFFKDITYHLADGKRCRISIKREVKGFNKEHLKAEIDLLDSIQEKYDQLPEKFRSHGISLVTSKNNIPQASLRNPNQLYALLTPTANALEIELFYPLLSINPPTWQSVTFEHPDEMENNVNKIKEIIEIERAFKVSQEALRTTSQFTQTAVPPAVSGIDLRRDLLALWRTQEWSAADMRSGGAVRRPEVLLRGLETLISKIETKADHTAVPHNPIEKAAYYKDLHSLLTHVTAVLQRSRDSYEVKETLITLAVAGEYCGVRWMGEALQAYQLLSGDIQRIDDQSLKERILFWIDQHKSSVVSAMASESSGGGGATSQSTHLFISLVKRLTNLNAAKFAVSSAASFDDPYASRTGPYAQDDALLAGFKRRCSASELAQKVEELLLEKMKKNSDVSVQMLELRHDAVEKFHTTAEERTAYADNASKRHMKLEQILENLGYVKDDEYDVPYLTLKGHALLLRYCNILQSQ